MNSEKERPKSYEYRARGIIYRGGRTGVELITRRARQQNFIKEEREELVLRGTRERIERETGLGVTELAEEESCKLREWPLWG